MVKNGNKGERKKGRKGTTNIRRRRDLNAEFERGKMLVENQMRKRRSKDLRVERGKNRDKGRRGEFGQGGRVKKKKGFLPKNIKRK